MEDLKTPLHLVEYTVDEGTDPVWFWETDQSIKMSPTFQTLDKAMDWFEVYEERS